MYVYDGIKRESMFLMAQNRFEDSKAFYEAHKEEIKQGVTVPMKQIASVIGEDMFRYDPKMELTPWKMVSRVRRDTRFSKSKNLYRENMWIMFMRPKKENPFVPCFWFEIFPDCYTCGVGTFETNSRVCQLYREKVQRDPEAFRKIIKSCIKTGAQMSGGRYKKRFPGNVPEDLTEIYNMKSLFFRKTFPDIGDLEKSDFLDELRKIYKQMYPFYKFMLEIYEEYEVERSEQAYARRN